MHCPITIRPAKASDAGAVEELYHELVASPGIRGLPERLSEIAADAHSFLLVAEHAGTACTSAFATLCLDAIYGEQPYAVLEKVVGVCASRGSGFGRRLMTEVECLCRRYDCSKLMLLSSAQRTEAHSFFCAMDFSGDRKQGFVKYRRHMTMVSDGPT